MIVLDGIIVLGGKLTQILHFQGTYFVKTLQFLTIFSVFFQKNVQNVQKIIKFGVEYDFLGGKIFKIKLSSLDDYRVPQNFFDFGGISQFYFKKMMSTCSIQLWLKLPKHHSKSFYVCFNDHSFISTNQSFDLAKKTENNYYLPLTYCALGIVQMCSKI